MMMRCMVGLLTLTLVTTTARAGLEEYVKKADSSFEWKLKGQRLVNGAKIYEIDLTSQTWQTIPWKHDLVVIVPPDVKPTSTMFLFNTGGKSSLTSLLLANDLATKMKAPVAFLFGIPAQPLFDGLREDALIAETFVRYLKTGDAEWPLLFPMVKSLVKAMDALQAFSQQEFKTELKDFVVAGASKRGWTTWLTAAVEPRVKAIAPMVIDTLNMQKQLPYQLESYGAYSEQIRDYTRRKLAPPPKTPEAQKLWAMVDPWVYRDKIKIPKLILNGTNDPYWTQDALNLYWDDLNGEKWICYVPNAGHNLQEKGATGLAALTRVGGTLPAFTRAYIHNKPLPKLTWKHGESGDKFTVKVTSDIEPTKARLWVADAPTRDFRNSTWKESPAQLNKGEILAQTEAPASGCRVFFVECEYNLDGLTCYFSTQVRIVGTPEKK